jgi:dsRNA-specific ribonuclease
MPSSIRNQRLTQVQKDAWIGDAILALWARLRILQESGAIDGPHYARITSNHCLAAIAEPSEAEARIGRAYLSGGLDAAFSWLDHNLLPILQKQEANRLKALSRPRPPRPSAERS